MASEAPSVVVTAVVGAAGWGKNVVRTFSIARGSSLRWVCDLNDALLSETRARHPGVKTTRALDDVLADEAVRAVAVAVDVPNHHAIARRVLASGRHVFVEKPLTLTSAEAEELCALAREKRLTLMVGHLLLYHPAIVMAKARIDAGELGDVHYLYSQRVNLGIVRETENAWWSLAPHDVAVAIHLFGAVPLSISATGAVYLRTERKVEDIAFAALRFPGERMGHIHVSWLDPHKRRSLTVVGSQKMLTFDDTAADEQVKIYDKSASPRPGHATYAEGVVLRSGDVLAPALPRREPLLEECEHFIECVRTGRRPLSDGEQGLAVVRVLEAGQRSLALGGTPVEIAGGVR
jgi:predicted dehydrogenase